MYRGVNIQLHAFWNSTLKWGEWIQRSTCAYKIAWTSVTGKRPSYSSQWRQLLHIDLFDIHKSRHLNIRISITSSSSKMALAVMLLICILEVLSSNLGQNTTYHKVYEFSSALIIIIIIYCNWVCTRWQ
jgi:hypothetical protein